MISFLIVNWNGGDIFKQCICSIEKNIIQAGIKKYEIVVVDNHSSDFDQEWLLFKKNIRFTRNQTNLQFATGTNQCVDYSTGDILFFLNNDVILGDNCLSALLICLKSGRADAVVPKLLYPNGDIQYSIRGFPTLFNILTASIGLHLFVKRLDTWLLRSFDYSRKQHVDQPMFSAVLMNRVTWDRVGRMDGKFPLLFNDVDWFFRFHRRKLKCLYLPEAEAIHIHGMSVNKNMFKKIIRSVASMICYFKKHKHLGKFGTILLYGISIIMLIVRILREGFICAGKTTQKTIKETQG